MSDGRVRRQLALGAVQLLLLTTASLSLAAVAQAQDVTEPAGLRLELGSLATTFSAVGEVIEYDYVLTNTGGAALDVPSVTDTMVADVACPPGPLLPDGTLSCAGSYAITQADLDAGSVTNIAVAFGAYGEGEVVISDQVSLTITAVATEPAALTLEMNATVTTFSAVNEVIEYDYVLTNTGGAALDALSVTDTMVADVACPPGPLEPGGTLSCVGSYAITQADLDAGSLTNVALGEGTHGEEVVASGEASLTITALAAEPAALTLELGAEGGVTTFGAVGEVIRYIYRLTNTGGAALDVLSVTDTMVGDVACGSGPLAPDQDTLCVGSYAITQADLDAGSLTNVAQASGTHGDEVVASGEASLTITALATEPAALTLELGAEGGVTTFGAVGEVIRYIYRLTNTGGAALDVLSVTDTMVGDVACGSGPLAPDQDTLCVGSYAITQADLDAGSLTNVAQASGTHGDEVVASGEASLTITALATEPAALTLELGAEGGVTTFGAVGEVIRYIYRLTNTGGAALDVLSVTDTMVGDVACGSGPLAPDQDTLCVGSYAITQADLDAGSLTNVAQASGTHGDEVVASGEASLTIAATEPAALTLELGSVATTFGALDDRIEYDYLLTNTGGVVLDVLSVSPKLGDVVCPSVSLRPDGAVLCVGYYYITQADLDAGSVTNVAQAYGTYGESGAEVFSDEASLTITAVAT